MAIIDKRTALFVSETREAKLNKGYIHFSSYLDLQNSDTEKRREIPLP